MRAAIYNGKYAIIQNCALRKAGRLGMETCNNGREDLKGKAIRYLGEAAAICRRMFLKRLCSYKGVEIMEEHEKLLWSSIL